MQHRICPGGVGPSPGGGGAGSPFPGMFRLCAHTGRCSQIDDLMCQCTAFLLSPLSEGPKSRGRCCPAVRQSPGQECVSRGFPPSTEHVRGDSCRCPTCRHCMRRRSSVASLPAWAHELSDAQRFAYRRPNSIPFPKKTTPTRLQRWGWKGRRGLRLDQHAIRTARPPIATRSPAPQVARSTAAIPGGPQRTTNPMAVQAATRPRHRTVPCSRSECYFRMGIEAGVGKKEATFRWPFLLLSQRLRSALLAEWTGLEPATPGVTGRYSNQLNYHSMPLRACCLRSAPSAANLASPRGFEPL